MSEAPAEPAGLFRRFAREGCAQEPLYVALCELIAGDASLPTLLAEAPPEQRKPNLLLAALHERVLAGAAPELAAYYASAGGERAPDAGLAAALAVCVERERPALLHHLRHGATQTNEVARGAAIWPALGAVAAATGARELALLDFGCSAALNLGIDRYALRYRTGDGRWHPRGAARDGHAAEIESLWLGDAPLPPEQPGWRLLRRDGLDPAPVDLNDPARLRWLQACLWPGDVRRRERLARAAAQLRALPVRRTRADDCIAAIEPWLRGLPPGVQPVLLTSWVLYYLNAADLARLRAAVDALALSHGLAWVCGELPALSARQMAPPLPALPPDESAASATLWTLRHRQAGRVAERALAWSHPHGRWVAWLG